MLSRLRPYRFPIIISTLAATAYTLTSKRGSSSSRPAPRDLRADDHWKAVLDPNAFHVLREKGTEPPFRNEYWAYKEDGVYKCGACDQLLFDSKTKYDSGTGWPSFYEPVSKDAVVEEADYKLLMRRTEVVCSNCHSHLGHVFSDGPRPTGQRYCMNSAALKFAGRSTKEDSVPNAN